MTIKKLPHFSKVIFFLTLFFLTYVSFSLYRNFKMPNPVFADGTVTRTGVTPDADAGSDAVSWPNAQPIMVDSYGHYIVIAESYSGGGGYYFNYSNDKGATWHSLGINGAMFRPTGVYDSIHDKIHVLAEDSSYVRYRRFIIKRDTSYNITSIVVDPFVPDPLDFENGTGCTAANGGTYPMLFFKDDGANGILAAFWEIRKTCGGVTVTQNRASMRTLSDSAADAVASNWAPIDGTDDSGSALGPSLVPFTLLYSYTGVPGTSRMFPHSAFIRGGSGSKSNDIYYFNFDEDEKWGFQRLAWNGSSNNWSGTWTPRTVFTNDVIGTGYSGNDEIISKPAYDPVNNRVYIGIPQYRNSTLKDSQSIYYVASDDSITDVGDVYNHKSGTFFAPTMDIMYNTDDSKLYVFYETSSTNPLDASQTDAAYEGDGWYRTYDGSSFGTPQPYFTGDIGGTHYTLDTPTVYKDSDNARIILFHRVDGSEGPFTPPHYIVFGYISSGITATNESQTLSGNYSATTFSDFDKSCATLTGVQTEDTSGGEIAVASDFRDDFNTPRSPYPRLFDNWTLGTWFSNTYQPTPSGSVYVYTDGGAYGYGSSTFTRKVIEFRAKYTNFNFQHIGFADTNQFNKYVLFSTSNNSSFNAEQNGGSGESKTVLGASYLGSYHIFKIDWGASDIKYYIDGSLVATITDNIPTTALNPVFSNGTTTSGSDLYVDWIKVTTYSTTIGTYLSCSLDSTTAGAVWGTITYNKTTPASTSVTIKTRTSSDNSSWSAWSNALTSGDTITSSAARYLQYQVSLVGTSTSTSTLDNIAISFAAPTSTPTPTSVPTSASTSFRPAGAPSCQDTVPSSAPWLSSAVAIGASSVNINFTNAGNPVDHYTLEYGTKSGEYIYGVDSFGDIGKSNQTYTIGSLASNTTYYIRVRGGNGCAVGPWSNELAVATKPLVAFKQLNVTATHLESVIETPSTATPSSEEAEEEPEDQTQTYQVNIKVKDKNDSPVVGAKVTIHSEVQEDITDENGMAHFTNVESGDHTILIAYDGFNGEESLNLSGDVKEFNLTVNVKPQNVFVAPQVLAVLGVLFLIIVILIVLLLRKNKLKRSS